MSSELPEIRITDEMIAASGPDLFSQIQARQVNSYIAKERAERELVQEGLDDTTGGRMKQWLARQLTFGGDGRDTLIEGRAKQNLRREAAGANAPTPPTGFLGRTFGRIGAAAVASSDSLYGDNSEYARLQRERRPLMDGGIPAAAGSIAPAAESKDERAARDLREAIQRNTEALKDKGAGLRGAPAPIGGPPHVQVRN